MAFIGIPLSDDIIEQLQLLPVKGKKTSTEDFHITLIFLGKDTATEQLDAAKAAVTSLLNKAVSVSLEGTNLDYFPPNPQHKPGMWPSLVIVKSPELHKLRARLVKALNRAGVEYSKKHPGFKPHITLSYSARKPTRSVIDPPIDWLADRVHLFTDDGKIYSTWNLAPMKSKRAQAAKLLTAAKLLLAGSPKAVLKKVVEDYMGKPVDSIEIHPDPQVGGTWAIQTVTNGETYQWLYVDLQGKGDPDELEETEFNSWPPTSGQPKFHW